VASGFELRVGVGVVKEVVLLPVAGLFDLGPRGLIACMPPAPALQPLGLLPLARGRSNRHSSVQPSSDVPDPRFLEHRQLGGHSPVVPRDDGVHQGRQGGTDPERDSLPCVAPCLAAV
jgi:hypothetical protein